MPCRLDRHYMRKQQRWPHITGLLPLVVAECLPVRCLVLLDVVQEAVLPAHILSHLGLHA